MVEKVTFDADNRLIIVNNGIMQLDAEADLYSAAKRMWKDNSTLNKLRLPFRTVAGDPLGQNREIGPYFFLQNQVGSDWRIRPHEADHELTILGNLYAENVSLPIKVPTLGGYTVIISIDKSSLTQVIESNVSGLTEEESDRLMEIQDIKAKTDSLPPDPTSTSELADIHGEGNWEKAIGFTRKE